MSSNLISLPNSNFTPSSFISSISKSTTLFGSLVGVIPYLSTPPALACFSKIVVSTPAIASSLAHASDAGPAPISATFFPIFLPAPTNFADIACSSSTRYLCILPICIGLSIPHLLHSSSHILS